MGNARGRKYMFSTPKIAIGIDLGSHSVKAIQLSKFGDSPKVDKALLLNLDSDGSDEGRMEATITAMRTIAATFDAKKAVLATALPGEDSFIRYLRFPQMPPDELRSSIELEADQNLPYDLTELMMDSIVLEEITERNETIIKVLLVAAKSEVIRQTISYFQNVGLSPSLLGVSTLAIADSFEANNGFKVDESVALINIGASSTNIHFCRDGISNFTRDISRAGRDLTGAIQKLLKVGFAEAEQMKIGYGQAKFEDNTDDLLDTLETHAVGEELGEGETPIVAELDEDGYEDATTEPLGMEKADDASRIVNATRPALSRLIGEIRRSIDYYEKQLYEKSVDKLVLSGGSALFPGLDQSLADATGVPVEIVDPVQAFIVDESSPEVAALMENRAQFNVAVGLAARGVEAL
jgi:type IV pilus assembly protein PilM